MARQVLVGLRDKRTQARPVFTTIDVSQEIRMQYQAETGSTLWVDIGRRRMGPFPEKDGFVSAVFEQRFGDWQAQVEIEDDLGNRSRAVERLPKPEKPNVLFVPMGRLTAHAQAIDLYILAQGEGGRSQGALTMSCQTPRVGALELVRVQEGLWHTRLQLSKDAIQSLPVRCDAFGSSYATRLSAPQGVARNLRIRAYRNKSPPIFHFRIFRQRLKMHMVRRWMSDRSR